MVGFLSADGAAYLADAMASEGTIEKYGIPFLYDPGIYMETLDRIAAMEAKIFVGSHIAPAKDIAPLARFNRAATEKVIARILSMAAEPIGFEALLAKLFESYALAMSIDQYALVGSTVRSYLSYLLDEGRIETLIENGILCWKSK
jgi:hypothetical protein